MRLDSAKVRARRKAMGLSRGDVAQRVRAEGVTADALYTAERAAAFEVEDDVAERIARALDIDVDELRSSMSDEPAAASSSSGKSDDRATQNENGPLDRALDAVFDPSDHVALDRFAVEGVLRYVPIGFIPPREINAVARAWLDAAAVLRGHDVVPTFLTLAHCVAALDGYPADHAKRLLAEAQSAGALEADKKQEP